ncbi:MAG: TIGR04282 family arsenosugar biosynthesis glycosyltransferase [Gaiellaceae bacterium MAG52_C11]|nr:TIGR04282 family arsenosugar biosynthesis glycosyltransferase [Candidatus Gaiellasilicea maunaloa]
MSVQLTIAAKAPLAGHVKTRLAAAIGDAAAAELYGAFLRDLAARFPEAAWFVSPLAEWEKATDCYLGRSALLLEQPPGDWTERQRAFFRGAAARGEERSVLVASDSPQLPGAIVAEAFALLDRHELVLGPVTDGGYYLIGMRGWHDVLAGVAMSTSSVLGELVSGARAQGLRVALVEPTYDVDEVEDLELLALDAAMRDDLPATRAALAALEVTA